jgi:hypothetical protein
VARPLYSLRIFATGGLTPAAGIVGPTVPAGLIYVLRDIDVVEISSNASAIVQAYGPTGGVLWVYERAASLNSAYSSWRGRQVFDEGEQVGFSSQVGTWAIAASGYQLTKP